MLQEAGGGDTAGSDDEIDAAQTLDVVFGIPGLGGRLLMYAKEPEVRYCFLTALGPPNIMDLVESTSLLAEYVFIVQF
jgi:hypothetical protein